MSTLRKLLLFLLVLVPLSVAVANVVTCTQYRGFCQTSVGVYDCWVGGQAGIGGTKKWYQSKADAGQAAADLAVPKTGTFSNCTYGITYSYIDGGGLNGLIRQTRGNCTASNGQSSNTAGTTDFFISTETQQGQCTVCATSDRDTFLPVTGFAWVTGFASDGRAIVKPAPGSTASSVDTAPTNVCSGGCQWASIGAPTDYLVGKDPNAQGLHVTRVEQNYGGTGSTCTSETDGLSSPNSSVTSPTCASLGGALGQVNGQAVCVAGGGAGGGPTITPGTSVTTTGTTTTGTVGPNGELGNAPSGSSDLPSGSGGGSTGPSGSTVTTGTTTTSTPPGATQTFTAGPVTSNPTPGVPVLYSRKYTQEPAAYFTSSMSTATGTLTAMTTAFFPTGWSDAPSGCPQFSVALDFGRTGWNFGTWNSDIPCWVWTACRWVIIISAVFLARALIFGG